MKINQMKKDELFEGFYLIKSAEIRKTRAGKDYIAFTSKMILVKFLVIFGMLNPIMLKNLSLAK